jgi:hypothetical protein
MEIRPILDDPLSVHTTEAFLSEPFETSIPKEVL